MKLKRSLLMSRDEVMFLKDILLSCEKILNYTEDLTLEKLIEDEKTYDAVVRNLEIIGEAAKHISEQTRKKMPEIPWRNVAGLRDFITHVYFGIDNDILWDVVRNKIPQLQDEINNLLKE